MTSEPHPEAQAFLEAAADGPDLHALPPDEARAVHREMSRPSGDPEPVDRVEDLVVHAAGHGLPVRVYVPDVETPAPVLVWTHGGGWLLGDLDTEDPTARALANASGCLVVSVDYRLAPEHPFPAALRDVVAAVEWAVEESAAFGGDPDRVAVGGASAGGALAAGTTLLARHRGGPPVAHQLLVYPVTNYTREFESYGAYDGYFLTREEHHQLVADYLPDPLCGHNPLAFPLEAAHHRELPPATVVTAEFDPLRDDGVAYAEALAEDGVDVRHRHYDDMVHTFFGKLDDPEWERAREAVDAVGADLRRALGE